MDNPRQRQGCLGRSAVLLFVIAALALATFGFMIYSLTDRPAVEVVEPMGPNTAPTPPESVPGAP